MQRNSGRGEFPRRTRHSRRFWTSSGRRRPTISAIPHLNIATLAGIIRMALKAYDAAHGLETERNVIAYINRNGFWQGK